MHSRLTSLDLDPQPTVPTFPALLRVGSTEAPAAHCSVEDDWANPSSERLINCPGRTGSLATFYCPARLHTINPTSQWNCPGNSPLNYRVWFLVYKALLISFRGSTMPSYSQHPLRGSWGTKGSRIVQISKDPQLLSSKGLILGWGRWEAGGLWGLPRGTENLEKPYPGMPFMVG